MFLRLIALVFVLALVGLPSAPANAQGAGTSVAPVFVVLDVGAIRREASSVKSIREQIISYQNGLQAEIQKEQEALRSAQQELAKKQTLLAPEAFAEERRKFEKNVVGVQQLVQDRRRGLEESQNKAMLLVEKTLNDIVAEMATKNGYALVLRRSQVVIVDSSLDITEAVLKELNAKLPSVKVDAPKQ